MEQEVFKAGFLAGFLESSEGYNRDYPFGLFAEDTDSIDAEAALLNPDNKENLLKALEKAWERYQKREGRQE